MSRLLALIALVGCAACLVREAAAGEAAGLPPAICGMSPGDWCPAPPGDPCGAHRDVTSCRADPRCYGMPYQGESLVACTLDKRGFPANCPTVGCTSRPPTPGQGDLPTADPKKRGAHEQVRSAS